MQTVERAVIHPFIYYAYSPRFPTIGIHFFVTEGKPQSIFRCCLLERSLTCREQVLLRYTCTVKKNTADNKVLLLSLYFSCLSFFDEKGPPPSPSPPCPCSLPPFCFPLQPLFSPSGNSWGALFCPGFHIVVVLKKRNWGLVISRVTNFGPLCHFPSLRHFPSLSGARLLSCSTCLLFSECFARCRKHRKLS